MESNTDYESVSQFQNQLIDYKFKYRIECRLIYYQ